MTLFGDTPRAWRGEPTATPSTRPCSSLETRRDDIGTGRQRQRRRAALQPRRRYDAERLPGSQVPGVCRRRIRTSRASVGVGLVVKFNETNGRWEDRSARAAGPTPCVSVCRFGRLCHQRARHAAGRDRFVRTSAPSSLIWRPTRSPGRVYVISTDANNARALRSGRRWQLCAPTCTGTRHRARRRHGDAAPHCAHVDALPLAYRTVPMPAGIRDDNLTYADGHGGEQRRPDAVSGRGVLRAIGIARRRATQAAYAERQRHIIAVTAVGRTVWCSTGPRPSLRLHPLPTARSR